jgi:predicted nucleic acid-binding protein
MMVLVDTPIWSLALRRRKEALRARDQALESELADLLQARCAYLIGPVRQEVLSGLREEAVFLRLRDLLRPFPEPALTPEDYELAAEYSNRCRASGIGGSPTDFLICAVAARRDWQIFTADRDFGGYARHLPITLFRPRKSA